MDDSGSELWGGVECTVNRVGDRYFDQLEFSGHDDRIDDLDRFASLGVKALRYPLLWERHQPFPFAPADWSWADQRLRRLRLLGVRPIVGLVHHGSGPAHTSLVKNDFAAGLAVFAGAVARRFPWVEDYTPVNEPLTTARFAGLYGHWHPHGRDPATFCRALLTQCRAVALAMRAIRAVNSAARLIQTDDLGETYSSPALTYQADFDNERRWLTWDLLTGRVDRSHPLRAYFLGAGCSAGEVDWFADNPCAPDIIGMNYYVTSERYLDDRVEFFPSQQRGGNGRHAYVDLDAVRIRAEGLTGAGPLLSKAWERYGLPIAITEAHLGCTREEQLRWFMEIWRTAQVSREQGVDVRAVTAWSLLGSFDWNSLLTRCDGNYESGVYDLRGSAPRPTALVQMLRDISSGQTPTHPVLAAPGWWRRPTRLLHSLSQSLTPEESQPPGPPILIAGAGRLGQAVARICRQRGLAHCLLSRQELDIADADNVDAVIRTYEPWAVVNAAGLARIESAERDPIRCHRENTMGPAILAAACDRYGAAFMTFSSDLVFDGQRRDPYCESHPVGPLNVYGRSKAAAERAVLAILPSALIVRTSALFGPWDATNFLAVVLRALAAGEQFHVAADVTLSPTYLPDLVHACLDLLIDREEGVWHLANEGETSWADFASRAADIGGFDRQQICRQSFASLGHFAARPSYCSLLSERGRMMPTIEKGLERYFDDRRAICAAEPNACIN